jgi:hypothetical protein
MSLTSPIPPQMRAEMAEDKFYNKCCIADIICSGRIEWHHNLLYKGKRVNEKFCILPVCSTHHRMEASFKDRLNYIMLNRATDYELKTYSKATDYIAMRDRLNKKYEIN